jgi:hypothetical protein
MIAALRLTPPRRNSSYCTNGPAIPELESCRIVVNTVCLRNSLNTVVPPDESHLPRPSGCSDATSDLFALGSAMYEIMVGHEPYRGLDELDDEDEFEKRYMERRFPALDGVLGSELIRKCWSVAYTNAHTCVEELEALKNILIHEN